MFYYQNSLHLTAVDHADLQSIWIKRQPFEHTLLHLFPRMTVSHFHSVMMVQICLWKIKFFPTEDSRVDLALNDVQIKVLKTLADTNRRSTHAMHHAGRKNFKTSSPLLSAEL